MSLFAHSLDGLIDVVKDEISDLAGTPDLLRGTEPHPQRAGFVELLYDVVLAFTRLSERLAGDLTWRGFVINLILLMAMWWVWYRMAWTTNRYDPNQAVIQLMVIGTMLATLVMATALPEVLGDRGVVFAGVYVGVQVLRHLWLVLLGGNRHAQMVMCEPCSGRSSRQCRGSSGSSSGTGCDWRGGPWRLPSTTSGASSTSRHRDLAGPGSGARRSRENLGYTIPAGCWSSSADRAVSGRAGHARLRGVQPGFLDQPIGLAVLAAPAPVTLRLPPILVAMVAMAVLAGIAIANAIAWRLYPRAPAPPPGWQ